MSYATQDFRPRQRRPRDWPPGAYFFAGSAWALFVFWWLMRWVATF